jgi:hypothetical protein
VGELQHEAFQLTFSGFLNVAFQGSRVTSDAGLILVRELDERSWELEALCDEKIWTSGEWIGVHSRCSRKPKWKSPLRIVPCPYIALLMSTKQIELPRERNMRSSPRVA